MKPPENWPNEPIHQTFTKGFKGFSSNLVGIYSRTPLVHSDAVGAGRNGCYYFLNTAVGKGACRIHASNLQSPFPYNDSQTTKSSMVNSGVHDGE
jgi:hypothetical protein